MGSILLGAPSGNGAAAGKEDLACGALPAAGIRDSSVDADHARVSIAPPVLRPILRFFLSSVTPGHVPSLSSPVRQCHASQLSCGIWPTAFPTHARLCGHLSAQREKMDPRTLGLHCSQFLCFKASFSSARHSIGRSVFSSVCSQRRPARLTLGSVTLRAGKSLNHHRTRCHDSP